LDAEQLRNLMIDGDDAIDLESFTELVKVVEPQKSAKLSEADLKQMFDAYVADPSTGTMDRREYLRYVMFERLSNMSTRAVEVFVAMDSNRSGSISRDEFHSGLRKLGLGPNEGFSEADGDAMFDALDADASDSLEYNELATAMNLPKKRRETLDRLVRKKQPQRRVAGRKTSVIGDRRRSGEGGRRRRSTEESLGRADRRGSIVELLDKAEASANKQKEKETAPRFDGSNVGDKTRALQNLADEVESIYAQYRAMRTRIGPLNDPRGRLDALLSPRNFDGPRGSSRQSSPRAATPKQPPETSWAAPGSSDAHAASATDTGPSAATDDEPERPRLKRGFATNMSALLVPEQDTLSSTPRRSSSPRWASSNESMQTPVSNLAPALLGSPRGKAFAGPQSAKNAVSQPASARRPNAEVPPSSQLPSLLRVSAEDQASSEGRWGDASAVEKEKSRLRRQGTQRDHHEHVPHHRDASAWQKHLRQQYRTQLVKAETEHVVSSEQMTKVTAFQCFRDAMQVENRPAISKELELGSFGNVGMGIGSRPLTPTDEHAMRDWVVDSGFDLTSAPQKDGEPVRKRVFKPLDDMDTEELRAFLAEPGKRTSFGPILDILEFHGVLKEFEEAGAPGLGLTDHLADGSPPAEEPGLEVEDGAKEPESESADASVQPVRFRPAPPAQGAPGQGTPRTSKLKGAAGSS